MAIFLAQFVTVYLLGVQSRCSGYYLAAAVGKLPADAWFSAPWWAYIAAGPVAICSAIKTHPHLSRVLRKRGG